MYRYYPDEVIEEIRINNDIVDVINEYVKLDKKGKDYFGLCPFHKEKTPSFSVAPAKQIFYCFGCGKGGNVIQFIMNIENLDYMEALKYLADRAKIQLPEGESEEEIEKARLKREIIKINKEAAHYFYNNLNNKQNENTIRYLNKRSINGHTIRRFGLGYSSEERDSLYKYLLDKGFDGKAIIKSGLVLPNKSGGYYDRFRGRVMFPIFDIRGNVVGFGGRVIDSALPKYINSPETLVYSKGKNLYALNIAKNSGEKRIIVVEGYMDTISLHQNGITNTVASLGTALTESQGRILKKYTDEVIIAYDTDTAGQAAAMRGLELLNDIGCGVKVLILPSGKDPDEFIRNNGAGELKKLIDGAVSLIEYKIKNLKNQINTENTEGKINFLNKIADVLAKIDNNVEREIYTKKLSKEYGITEESLSSEIYKRTRPKLNFKSMMSKMDSNSIERNIVNKDTKDGQLEKLAYYERILLAFLCIDNKLYKQLKNRIRIEDFTSESNKQTAEVVFDRLESDKDIMAAELFNILEGSAANDFAKTVQNECNCEDTNKAVQDIIKKIETVKMGNRGKEIIALLKNENNLSEGDVVRLKMELNTITKQMKT